METTVNERIESLVEHLAKGNKSAFARAIGISNQSLGEIIGGRQSAPSFAALQKILTAFPQVCMEWFIFGRGPMLTESTPTTHLGITSETAATVQQEVANVQQAELTQLRQQVADMGKQVDFLLRRVAEIG